MRLGWYMIVQSVAEQWTDERENGNRSVTSRYHGSKISISTINRETAITIDERWKNSIGHRFVPELNHA